MRDVEIKMMRTEKKKQLRSKGEKEVRKLR